MQELNYPLCQRNRSLISLSRTMSPIIILTTLPKRIAGVAKAARMVTVHIPKSNKGHSSLLKTCLLALLSLSSTSTLNAHKLTSKWYPLYGPPALCFRSLPFSTALNCCMTKLAIVLTMRMRMVTVVVLPTTKAIFQTWNLL